jgi:hypothetical protein
MAVDSPADPKVRVLMFPSHLRWRCFAPGRLACQARMESTGVVQCVPGE